MKTIKQTLLTSMTLALTACCTSLVYAGELQQVQVGQATAGESSVRLKFDSPTQKPKVFELQNPPRIVFDFPATSVVDGLRRNSNKAGVVQGVDIAGGGNKARVVTRLSQASTYTLKHEGKDIVILFKSGTGAAGNPGPAPQAGVMKPVRSAPVKTPKPVKQVALADVPAPKLAPGTGYNWYNDPNKPKAAPKPAPKPVPRPAPRPVPVAKPAPVVPPPVAVPVTKPVPAASVVPHRQGITQQALSGQHTGAPPAAPQYATAAPAPSMPYRPGMSVRQGAAHVNTNALRTVDFRREPDGGGRIILTLPSADTKVDADKAGNALKLTIRDVDVPGNLRKRMNVTDFATPVSTVHTSQRGMDGLVTVLASQGFKHRVERNRNVLNVYVDKIAEKKKLQSGEQEKKNFKGDKLSLNFQDIEVRAVLQLLADFTDKNIVVSDSVEGSITVRLKDVPWDQALDIVLESKNLGMRENGNVIWVAPATELEAKEAKALELAKRKIELEPLITEYIAINFAKASELSALIEKRSTDKTHSLLSDRGSVSWDERTNTLLVQDTASRVDDIRDLIKVLDVPVQQVLIESRIVIANDEFGKELGARFGIMPARVGSTSMLGLGNLGEGSDTFFDSLSDDDVGRVTIPGLNDRLSVNLPVTGAAGSFGFSILSPDFMLDLELSALQADSKGEIVSTPRVITSNQKKAVIEQGVEIPYLQASSSGATNVAFKKAVLSLEVTPQITPDEHVSMDLKVNQDTVGQVFSGVPSINTREVETKVLVENGQTVVLGGVHEEETLNGVTKVPVLGDLPVVGRVFRTTNNSDKKRELLIFVTPKIVDAKQ